MILPILLIIGGIILLIRGASWMVQGGASLARVLGVSPLIIGLTVVAFGTTSPELFVNLSAVWSDRTDIAVANIIGSNIANILLVLGVVTAIRAIQVKRETVVRQIPMALLAAIMFLVVSSDSLLVEGAQSVIDRADGLVLLGFFAIFLHYIFYLAEQERLPDDVEKRPWWAMIGLMSAGLLGLVVGGELTVRGATDLALVWGWSERLIGITVIAIGTSLPELVTTIVATMRKESDMAIGNCIGSNIFNTLWIIGISSVIRPLPVSEAMRLDMLIIVAATLALIPAIYFGRRHVLQRWSGFALIGLYVVYLVIISLTG